MTETQDRPIKVHVEFPRYSARWEHIVDGRAVTETEREAGYVPGQVKTDIAYCPICGAKTTERTFVILKQPQERTDEEQAEHEAMAHRDAELDSETFMEHLKTAHPEELQ